MSLETAYRFSVRAATPLIRLVLARRIAAGKEDPVRQDERWGRSAIARPPGALLWLHGASVGEALSLLPLIERLQRARPEAAILVTTGTVTSARLMAARLPSGRAWHQYAPLDHPDAVGRFLDHWRPDLAIWVESELWPCLVLETRRRHIPMALLNARLSERSWRRWRRAPGLIRRLLDCFDLVLAQDAGHAARLRALGAVGAETVGDLKAAAVVPRPPASLDAQRALVEGRPVWLAASTHPGEEAVVAAAHRALRPRFPGLLTILAPRHPARAEAVLAALGDLAVVRRSAGEDPGPATDIWLVDTMGELDLFYRLAPVVLVAGSLGPPGRLGGHNPLEAAALGSAVLHGANMTSCAASAASLDGAGGALEVDAATLVPVLDRLLGDPAEVRRMGEAARLVAEGERGVADHILARLAPLLPPLVLPVPSHAGA